MNLLKILKGILSCAATEASESTVLPLVNTLPNGVIHLIMPLIDDKNPTFSLSPMSKKSLLSFCHGEKRCAKRAYLR